MIKMFEEIFRSFKKSSKIKRLTKEYLKYSLTAQTTAFEALSTARIEARSKVFDEVLETAFREPNNQPVIKKFNLDKRKLEEIVEDLELNGGGQYLGGHYISISSILYPQTLEFIVYRERKTQLDKNRMILRIFDYFKNGETGNIVEIDY
jgi:hypothetical protein